MKKLITLLVLISISFTGFGQKNTGGDNKNVVQIGKTGYYFDQKNPFYFGYINVWDTKYGQLPYISYARMLSPKWRVGISLEQYSKCYFCDDFTVDPPVYEIIGRYFHQFTLFTGIKFFEWKRLSLFSDVGIKYRFNWCKYCAGEFWVTSYPHPFESIGEGKKYTDWGIGGSLEVRYNFVKRFSLSAKAEYTGFDASPRQQFGAGVYLGYEF